MQIRSIMMRSVERYLAGLGTTLSFRDDLEVLGYDFHALVTFCNAHARDIMFFPFLF